MNKFAHALWLLFLFVFICVFVWVPPCVNMHVHKCVPECEGQRTSPGAVPHEYHLQIFIVCSRIWFGVWDSILSVELTKHLSWVTSESQEWSSCL